MKRLKTENSLWTNPCYPFRAWYRYVPWFFRRLKLSCQRARRGFSDYDVQDLDSYLTILISESLARFADTTSSCPLAAANFESWRNMLQNTSKYFKRYAIISDEATWAYKQYVDYRDELRKKYPKASDNDLFMIDPALMHLHNIWRDLSAEEEKKKKEYLRKGMENLALILPELWN
jgi:hypothetical protein